MSRRTGMWMFAWTGTLLWGLTAGEALGNELIEVCHAPPGNPANAHTITVIDRALDAHLAHGDTEGACGDSQACPCFDFAMLEALGDGQYGQQRWLDPDATSGNWVGILTGGSGFAQVTWTATEGTCNYNDWTDTQTITYDEALVCDALLNEFSLLVGATCTSEFCP